MVAVPLVIGRCRVVATALIVAKVPERLLPVACLSWLRNVESSTSLAPESTPLALAVRTVPPRTVPKVTCLPSKIAFSLAPVLVRTSVSLVSFTPPLGPANRMPPPVCSVPRMVIGSTTLAVAALSVELRPLTFALPTRCTAMPLPFSVAAVLLVSVSVSVPFATPLPCGSAKISAACTDAALACAAGSSRSAPSVAARRGRDSTGVIAHSSVG